MESESTVYGSACFKASFATQFFSFLPMKPLPFVRTSRARAAPPQLWPAKPNRMICYCLSVSLTRLQLSVLDWLLPNWQHLLLQSQERRWNKLDELCLKNTKWHQVLCRKVEWKATTQSGFWWHQQSDYRLTNSNHVTLLYTSYSYSSLYKRYVTSSNK